MSLIPLLYRDLWDDVDRPSRSLFDHNFGLGLRREDLLNSQLASFDAPRLRGSFLRPWGLLGRQNSTPVKVDDKNFQVSLDVEQFAPSEVTVKTVERTIVVEGKHEEKVDEHGFISRHFVRKYLLPADCEIEQISSTLSSDGVLTINAPKKTVSGVAERAIPITPTGPARPPVVTSPTPVPLAQSTPIITEINIPVTKQ